MQDSIISTHEDSITESGIHSPLLSLIRFSPDDLISIRTELRIARNELLSHGLYAAARTMSDLLGGMNMDFNEKEKELYNEYLISLMNNNDILETDTINNALVYMNCREYARAADLLKSSKSLHAVYLYSYCKWLEGERRKDASLIEKGPYSKDPRSNEIIKTFNNEEKQDLFIKSKIQNSECDSLRKNLDSLLNNNGMDAWLAYVYALVLNSMQLHDASAKMCTLAVSRNPMNWSAWLLLANVVKNLSDLEELDLPSNHWMYSLFMAHFRTVNQTMQKEVLDIYLELYKTFQNSSFIISKVAVSYYYLREFDISQSYFELLMESHPFALDNLDIYSNILYVKENRTKLSQLAYHSHKMNKYSPQSCCILGNYYSLRSEHEKAIVYFDRALKLDKNYLSAWTLMGHEYVELKNTSAAMEAYRNAVDIDPREFRAWYGLGQVYEILNMPYFALYYYHKATSLRPYDSRMWCAVAACYESNGSTQDAIKCYERAASNKNGEDIAVYKLATLHTKLGDQEKAAFYYNLILNLHERGQSIDAQQLIDTIRFMAEYSYEHGDYSTTEKYCNQLLEYGGSEKEDAKTLLMKIRTLKN